MRGRDVNGKPIITYSLQDHDYREIALAHSCDDWVIGSIEETEKFIAQLQGLLTLIKQNPEQDIDVI